MIETTSLITIFLTGLTTGGLTCIALQGALLASVITTDKNSKTDYHPIFAFVTSKLIVHTILGLLLGAVGASITLSPFTKGWFQIILGIYLFGIAGNLLNLHPIFRHFVLKPPKSILRFIKSTSTNPSPNLSTTVSASLLGAMTVFIPCATTQAMMITALGTANPVYSAAIMFAFILGTLPTFILFGFILEKGSNSFKKYFPILASSAMFIMSVYTINNGIALTGSPYTIQNFYSVATNQYTNNTNIAINNEVTITVNNSGYTPKNITLKKGVPAKIKLVTNNVQSCSRAFTIPELGIEKLLPITGTTIIEFTPTKTGLLTFSCSMGMYTGNFNVIN